MFGSFKDRRLILNTMFLTVFQHLFNKDKLLRQQYKFIYSYFNIITYNSDPYYFDPSVQLIHMTFLGLLLAGFLEPQLFSL